MDPYTIRQSELVGSDGQELWRIHVDLVDSYGPTSVGLPPYHACSGVSRASAEEAFADYQAQKGDGIRFESRDGSRSWFYPWQDVTELRVMPMREAL